ncbi:uncharacterized protein P174DRAFT_502333 [Aspergillus novofumigatus IBT 16806]|uniref:Uncharacterized protein n=1 Tax=Aspergillus novofumigatus (strain IBT 16806) TaxID=1392255 RepID=A0A2I1CB44_ASPN1|nr:uncharacterized protein P174DRAFT_502333 [Aspergillus novofumigatus IBT 16806]PKX94821.1 hypothetical protein P174DRAFT_502333 [Aspergillus novofumigatus IBT 16806]
MFKIALDSLFSTEQSRPLAGATVHARLMSRPLWESTTCVVISHKVPETETGVHVLNMKGVDPLRTYNTKRAKLPAPSLDAFLNSVINLAKKTREQPSGQEILGKLNSLQPIIEDITLIKNAVNNALASHAPVAPNAATRIASWADVVRSGTPSYPSTPNSRASTTASVKDRETVVKLEANAAAVLRQVSSEDLCKRVNDALGSRINLLGKAPKVIAAKQLKSGDVVLHTATTAEADTLKDTEEEWVKVLGTSARVVRPTYGVIVHGVRTSKESIDTDNQQRAIEKIESENAVLHEGARVTRADSSSAINAMNTATSDPSAMPKSDADTAQESTTPKNAW